MATLIGRFNADQPRDRWLTRDPYSYVVVGFDERLLLVATRPGRDGAAALIHRGARLASHLAPHTKPAIKLGRAVLQAGPKYASVEASISALAPLTPERVAAAFPTRSLRSGRTGLGVRSSGADRGRCGSTSAIPLTARRRCGWFRRRSSKKRVVCCRSPSATGSARCRRRAASPTRPWTCCPGSRRISESAAPRGYLLASGLGAPQVVGRRPLQRSQSEA